MVARFFPGRAAAVSRQSDDGKAVTGMGYKDEYDDAVFRFDQKRAQAHLLRTSGCPKAARDVSKKALADTRKTVDALKEKYRKGNR